MRKLLLKERAVSTAMILSMALVVIAFAVLQYRWSTESSEAAGVRLADSLQLSMINWHLDFFRNFSEVCMAMRIDPEAQPGSDLDQHIRRFTEWAAVARYPDLVSNVYLLRFNNHREPQVLRLNSDEKRFEPAPWPATLAPLREDLTQAASSVWPAIDEGRTSGRPFAGNLYNIGDALRGWRFEPAVPSLLHRIADSDREQVDRPLGERGTAGWIVIEMDRTVIQNRILPDLAHRYFQGTDGLDYQVAVVAGTNPRRVIYSSDAGFGQHEVADADGTMDVFGRVRDKALGSPIYVFHKTSQSGGPTAAVGISWFPLLRDAPEEQDWELVVRHRRGGPLGAFVTEMHRRDLAISFGALLLLVISMGMLVVTTNRAQRLAKLQMDFVTAVSHDLRTPLTVISSAADNIAHGVIEGKAQLQQYGAVIGTQVRQLSGRVEEILLFAATRQGHQRYSPRRLDVSEIIDATLASTEDLIHAAQVTVERRIDPNLPQVSGDLLALSQCLQNLIINALKYGKGNRWIGIRASVGKHDSDANEVHIGISDRGIGIEPADLPHIFEPFYRSRRASGAQIHGTGLGLSLASDIAEAMKGRLTVTTTPEGGSTFTLHLPIAEPLFTGSLQGSEPKSR